MKEHPIPGGPIHGVPQTASSPGIINDRDLHASLARGVDTHEPRSHRWCRLATRIVRHYPALEYRDVTRDHRRHPAIVNGLG